ALALVRELKGEARKEAKDRARAGELEARTRAQARATDRFAEARAPSGRLAEVRPGATVYVRDLGVTARVVEGPDADGRVVLERGAWRIQSRAEQCLSPESVEASAPPGRGGADRGGATRATSGATPVAAARAGFPETEPVLEVDLRGLQADDADRRLEEALDRAV